jgi:hypothetical protein
LITGILSANAEFPSIDLVMSELQELARAPVVSQEEDATNLPQVHAMNSIKDIFKVSTLGKRSDPYISKGLQLAALSLKSEM